MFICLLMPTFVFSQEKQEIDSLTQQELWKQPDFVRAYYVVAEPGGALYSVFGHAALHLACPAYGLDYVFSYESEGAINRLWSFLAGNLKMGMTALSLEEYLSGYAEEGRGVKQYEFNLPINKKRELWRVLDEKVQEGMFLPYDYEARGCAYSCVAILEEALGDAKIEYGEWSPRFNRTRREIANDNIKHTYPWNLLALNTVVGADFDKVNDVTEKLIMPNELAEVWQQAKFNGEYLLSRDAQQLLPSRVTHQKTWFTPIMAALLLLVLAIVSWFIEKPYIDWLILAIVTLLGVVVMYLVLVSSLPCTKWNWLIIPFNILPALCWKWRRYWALSYAVVICLWSGVIIAWPSTLTDEAWVGVAIALVITLLNRRNNSLNKIFPWRGKI